MKTLVAFACMSGVIFAQDQPATPTSAAMAEREAKVKAAQDALRSKLFAEGAGAVDLDAILKKESQWLMGINKLTPDERYNLSLFIGLVANKSMQHGRQETLTQQAPAKPEAPATVPTTQIRVSTSSSKQTILKVLGDGAILQLDDGSMWEVASYDRYNSSLWLPLTDVVVVDDEKIVNLDDSESVEAQRVR